MSKAQRIKKEKTEKHLEQLFIGMDQQGTRFSGVPKDILHLFLSSQIDLINEVFMPDGSKTDKINLVKSMALDVIKIYEEEPDAQDIKEDNKPVKDYQI